jgi:signal transduction histidine kinase
MSVLQNMAIKHKLILIIMLASITALLLAGTVCIVWEWTDTRQDMVQDLLIDAEMIADNCKAALAFKDAEDAKEVLESLHVKSSVVFGCVYTNSGEVFASYYRDDTNSNIPLPKVKKYGYNFSDGVLTVFKPIVLDVETIGTVCLRSDLHPMYAILKRNTGIIIVALLLASSAAYFVSSRLQGIISRPILNLAGVAKVVSERKNYSARAVKQSSDEVGLLIDAFNEMLEQIQQRDSELVAAKVQLETRVKERTAALTTANEQLRREISVRERAEKKQAELLEKLEKANQELKDFAYIVSHDLKAPLRGIKTLVDWMSTDYADKLDEEGREQMDLLLARVDRMHNLIDGVLAYSRVGRTREKEIQVNLNQLVPEIIDTIAPPENITITIENELPVIECEQTRIIQIFQNLLSNAVKYMDKPQGQVRVGCVEEDGFWKFSVADNGPGIEEKHFEKIFQMFQTLSPRDEYESTGVGLTVIKKIVELYNGKIWVESKPGEGSTFFFTLPKQEMGGKDAKLETNIVSRR